MCLIIYLAGNTTTSSLVSNGLYLLTQHPDQQARLAATPEAVPNATEELLRYESPVQWTSRITTGDVEMHGRVVPAGSRVMMLLAAAHRDPRVFDDPGHLRRVPASSPPSRLRRRRAPLRGSAAGPPRGACSSRGDLRAGAPLPSGRRGGAALHLDRAGAGPPAPGGVSAPVPEQLPASSFRRRPESSGSAGAPSTDDAGVVRPCAAVVADPGGPA